MPQTAKQGWGARPKKTQPAAPDALDRFVNGAKIESRLNVILPKELRGKFKSKCAKDGVLMGDVIRGFVQEYVSR
jgi:ParG